MSTKTGAKKRAGARAGARKKKATPTAAQRADRYKLYERAVQCVEAEIDFVDDTYLALRGRRAKRLREDFCGTGNTSCEWVRRRPGNEAVGVDIDPEPLEWGLRNHVEKLTPAQRRRIRLVQGDVRTVRERGFDAVLAMNFSYWCFEKRSEMLRYFRSVRRSLDDRGLFFLDFYGGSDAVRELSEEKECPGGITYIWDQDEYDPITGTLKCYIHFRFRDGSRLRRAFEYTWRLWTIPELREVLEDAGFARTTVYWEGDDGEGGGDGDFKPAQRGEACPAYIAYLVAEK